MHMFVMGYVHHGLKHWFASGTSKWFDFLKVVIQSYSVKMKQRKHHKKCIDEQFDNVQSKI
jgi:hypothetical protein